MFRNQQLKIGSRKDICQGHMIIISLNRLVNENAAEKADAVQNGDIGELLKAEQMYKGEFRQLNTAKEPR